MARMKQTLPFQLSDAARSTIAKARTPAGHSPGVHPLTGVYQPGDMPPQAAAEMKRMHTNPNPVAKPSVSMSEGAPIGVGSGSGYTDI